MRINSWVLGVAVLVLSVLVCQSIFADKLVLENGTVLEGKVIKQGDQYWIKTTDGDTKLIPASEVKSLTKTESPALPPRPVTPATPTTPTTVELTFPHESYQSLCE